MAKRRKVVQRSALDTPKERTKKIRSSKISPPAAKPNIEAEQGPADHNCVDECLPPEMRKEIGSPRIIGDRMATAIDVFCAILLATATVFILIWKSKHG